VTRRAGVALAVIAFVAALLSAACDRGRGGWEQTAPFAPSLRPAFGVRVTEGKLLVWTGSPCIGTTNVRLTFDDGEADQAELELTSRSDTAGVEVEHLTIGGPYPGFDVTKDLPAGFDWQKAQTLTLGLNAATSTWGSELKLADVVKGSADHPDDTYYFGDAGWLNPGDVAAKDGKTFLATCSDDPTKKQASPRVFGVRITDGTLRIWAGSPCALVRGVILTFQPGQADLVLDADSSVGASFEYLTVGGPYPGFQVAKDLPDGFDWRTAKSVLLRLRAPAMRMTTTTDLAKVAEESAQHPEDAYWFEGFGWLDRAGVAAQGGTFLDACAK